MQSVFLRALRRFFSPKKRAVQRTFLKDYPTYILYEKMMWVYREKSRFVFKLHYDNPESPVLPVPYKLYAYERKTRRVYELSGDDEAFYRQLEPEA